MRMSLDRRQFFRLAGLALIGLCAGMPFAIDASATDAELLAVQIKRQPIESTSLASAGYDPKLRVLEIEFRSGAIYRYLAVPAAVFEAFIKAESKGRYFAQHVRSHFEFRRLREKTP